MMIIVDELSWTTTGVGHINNGITRCCHRQFMTRPVLLPTQALDKFIRSRKPQLTLPYESLPGYRQR